MNTEDTIYCNDSITGVKGVKPTMVLQKHRLEGFFEARRASEEVTSFAQTIVAALR